MKELEMPALPPSQLKTDYLNSEKEIPQEKAGTYILVLRIFGYQP